MDEPRPFDRGFHDDLTALLATRDAALIRGLLAKLHPADLADMLEHLDDEERAYVFGLIVPEQRSQALAELEDGSRERLLAQLRSAEIADLIEELDSDDAVDVVQDLPAERAEKVLGEIGLPESRDVRRLLAYDEDTAGGIMATEFVAVPEAETLAQAIERLRRGAELQGDSPYVFVIDAAGRLSGWLSLRTMILSDPARQVSELVERDVRSVPATLDQEQVAEMARKYDLTVVPVVDDADRLIGQITIDDILDVYEQEASEDFSRLSGALQEESPADSLLTVSRNRLPWLLLGLLGGILSAYVLSRHAATMHQALEIAFFVPVIMAMGGNVGIQSSATVVRGLATGEIREPGSRARLMKEILVGALNALILAAVLWLIVTVWLGKGRLGVVVGCSLALAMVFAAAVGAAVPLLLKRIGIDPALATGPFVTTANDLLGLILYLTATSTLLDWM
jgi:magnesium transporter